MPPLTPTSTSEKASLPQRAPDTIHVVNAGSALTRGRRTGGVVITNVGWWIRRLAVQYRISTRPSPSAGISTTHKFMDVAAVEVSLADAQYHAGRMLAPEPLAVESSSEQWAYAVSVPLRIDSIELALPLLVSVETVVTAGELGIVLVGGDWQTLLGPVGPTLRPGRHTARLLLNRYDSSIHLVFRNDTAGGTVCVFSVHSVSIGPAPAPADDAATLSSRLSEVLSADGSRLLLRRLARSGDPEPTASHHSDAIDVVQVEALQTRLAFRTPLSYPDTSRHKPLIDWRMEVDDAPILRYLYRNFAPRRHLEFGTWEGTGACYCLEESDATVWTINLPGGERLPDGFAYSSVVNNPPPGAVPVAEADGGSVYQTDAGVFVGHKYRQAGFGHRVCQILCDSRDWDTSAYPNEFFDSVRIDGGHSEEVVLSDTRKALAVTRPGALIMWHDFCPDPTALSKFESARGVVGILAREWTAIRAHLQDAFWIHPSCLLLGIRAR